MPKNAQSIFRHHDALLPNSLATLYVVVGYSVSWFLFFQDSLLLNVLGVLWLTHSMVIAAYLIHELAHLSVFKSKKHNRWFAELLLWITGNSYSNFDDIQKKHHRHHTDRADIVSFDFRPVLERNPVALRIIQFMEWFYIPAIELIMHALVIILPYTKANRKSRRLKVSIFLILRTSLFIFIVSQAWQVILLYPIAYMIFLTVMRFMDIHQHTYEVFETLDEPRGPEARLRDREFEHHNTYSNLFSVKHPWINLLVLNFGYHNMHHDQQMQPWYRLPKLHKEKYGTDDDQLLLLKHLIKSFHKYRVPRVVNGDPINLPVKKNEGETFIGVDGVSFLTAH